MIVKDLISKLKSCMEDAEVWIESERDGGIDYVKISEIGIDVTDGDIYLKM